MKGLDSFLHSSRAITTCHLLQWQILYQVITSCICRLIDSTNQGEGFLSFLKITTMEHARSVPLAHTHLHSGNHAFLVQLEQHSRFLLQKSATHVPEDTTVAVSRGLCCAPNVPLGNMQVYLLDTSWMSIRQLVILFCLEIIGCI